MFLTMLKKETDNANSKSMKVLGGSPIVSFYEIFLTRGFRIPRDCCNSHLVLIIRRDRDCTPCATDERSKIVFRLSTANFKADNTVNI